jgi:hypothetical protein
VGTVSFHFTDEETEAQEAKKMSKATWLGSQGQPASNKEAHFAVV